jgi:urea transport system ATP-binding protein
MLKVEQINQYYGSSHTLRGVSLTVKKGQCMALLGRNGVGKTTLLKCLMGILPVARGKVEWNGRDITRLKPHQRAAAGIAYVPQGRDIFARLTVEENLMMGMATLPARKAATVSGEVYELFPVLKEMLHRRGGDLSGGQQQQLAIGRALMADPKLLILDEPTEGIQPNIVHQIGDILLELNEEGLTILLVEQKLPFARRVARHFTVLDRGRNVASGAMSELTDEIVQRHLHV